MPHNPSVFLTVLARFRVEQHIVDPMTRLSGCGARVFDPSGRRRAQLTDEALQMLTGSNLPSHDSTRSVLLHEYSASLDEHTDPGGVLRGVSYPHGLCFSSDGRHLFVADAGAPEVHIYLRAGDDWFGVRRPESTIKIMDEAPFSRGHVNPQEGGPKGLDLNVDSTVLVVTSEFQPLAFFDVPAMLEQGSARTARPSGAIDAQMDEHPSPLSQREQQALDVVRELNMTELEARVRAAEATLARLTNSMSWRVTAPLRRLRSGFGGLR